MLGRKFDDSNCNQSASDGGEKLRPLHHEDERGGELDKKRSNCKKKKKFCERCRNDARERVFFCEIKCHYQNKVGNYYPGNHYGHRCR